MNRQTAKKSLTFVPDRTTELGNRGSAEPLLGPQHASHCAVLLYRSTNVPSAISHGPSSEVNLQLQRQLGETANKQGLYPMYSSSWRRLP